jgi:hypothetical protein
MKKLVVGTLVGAVVLLAPRMLAAQSRTFTSEAKVATATVEAIEASTRTITLKKADGTYVTTVAGPDVKRFDEIKVGDKVTARYYDNLVLRLKAPGEADVSSASAAATGSGQALPGGTTAKQTTITATITAIDPNAPSITFTGPNGWKYTSRVDDTKALAKVKVGDKVDITWTEALLVSIERGQ